MEVSESKFEILICKSPNFIEKVVSEVENLKKFNSNPEIVLENFENESRCRELKVLLATIPKINHEMVQKIDNFVENRVENDQLKKIRKKTVHFIDETELDTQSNEDENIFHGINLINSFPILNKERALRKFAQKHKKEEKLREQKLSFELSKDKIVKHGGVPDDFSCSKAFRNFLSLLKLATGQFEKKFEAIDDLERKKDQFLDEIHLKNVENQKKIGRKFCQQVFGLI